MPTLLPEGLGPESHLAVALKLVHPMARPVALPWTLHHALSVQKRLKQKLPVWRQQMLSLVKELARVLVVENAFLLSLVHPWILPMLASKDLALFRELNLLCGMRDGAIVVDLVFGLPMTGWARHSPSQVQRYAEPLLPAAPEEERLAHNAKMMLRTGSTGDEELDTEASKKVSGRVRVWVND